MVRGLIILFFLQSFSALADESDLKLIALFKNSAMVEFKGKQRLIRNGQSLSPQIKLISANTKTATFLINGESVALSLNRNMVIQSVHQQTETREEKAQEIGPRTVQILRNLRGMYESPGFINGRSVHFLIDTGATTVAMNERVAKRIGIPYRTQGVIGRGSTAGGIVNTWQIRLQKVRVGTIELQNIQAVVIQGPGPDEVLLGQSFLNQLKVETEGNLLKLKKKF